MQKKSFSFSTAKVDYYFNGGFPMLKQLTDQKKTVIITDENVFGFHEKKFRNWNTIVLKAGEEYKVQATVDTVIGQLIEMEADRATTLVGVGGGVITDLTGYIGSVYMRGIKFGFVPTTLLGLVDASIGGKNGIDVDVYKNMVGTIRQPSFILHDLVFLKSLPEQEWQNGFAEIIKHAAIKDSRMFGELEKNNLETFSKKKTLLSSLVQRNALLKTKLVQLDEFEQGDRKLLNFGHTIGHALETQYELSHGQAISIGMTYAAHLSEKLKAFRSVQRITGVLSAYGLPTYAAFDKGKVMQVLRMDKKKDSDRINFILLEKIGKAASQSLSFEQLNAMIG